MIKASGTAADHSKKDPKNTDVVAIGDKESAYFPDGSNIVRVERLPWTPFKSGTLDLAGSRFKLLAVDWERDMYTMMLIVPGGVDFGGHYHVGNAHGYIMTGDFRYEVGTIFASDYTMEAGATEHTAIIGKEDILQLSIIFNGICAVTEDGKPDFKNYMGCKEIYRLAKENGAADHIPPPPPGWRSVYEIEH
jgi:hypothetical protein